MKRPILASFRTRVVALFVLLLLVTQGGGFLLINAAVLANADKVIRHELDTGQRIFNRLLEHDSQDLAETARIVAADYAFREAIATHDHTTTVSVLENHGARINAKLMMLVGLDNALIADMQRPETTGQVFPFPELIAAAEQESNFTTAIELVDGQAYQLAVVPVRAPLPIAWVVMGFLLDDQFAADLKALSALDISFVAQAKEGEWRILATTLPAEALDDMRSAVGKLQLEADNSRASSFFKNPTYNNLALPIHRAMGIAFAAVLHRSLDEALEPANRLRTTLFWLTLIVLLPSVLLAMLLARNVTHPVSALAQIAGGIARGDYSQEIKINRADEIGELASAFDSMRQGIEAREIKLRAILDTIPDGVVAADSKGTIQLFNPAAEKLFAYTREEVIGRSVNLLMPSPDHEAHGSYLTTGARKIIGINREVMGKRKDGSRFPLYLSVGEALLGQERMFVAVLHDLTAQKRAEAKLRALTTELLLTEERERRQLAADLHDDFGQSLALVKIKLANLGPSIDDSVSSIRGESLREVRELIDRANKRMRSLTFDLSPPILEQLGLVPAVQWLADHMEQHYHLEVSVEGEEDPVRLDEHLRYALFRAVRELLINVSKHAQTEQARVRFFWLPERVRLEVEDRGKGFDAAPFTTDPDTAGFGLFSTRERMDNLGGSFEIQSVPGGGTRVTLEVPLSVALPLKEAL